MNNLKSKAGFTLVELIVVIAILAILAGVGTAAYTGYINKANQAADITLLDAVKTACIAAEAKNGAVTAVKVEDKGATGDVIQVKINGAASYATVNTDFSTFFGSSNVVLKTGNIAEWTGAEWSITGTAVAN